MDSTYTRFQFFCWLQRCGSQCICSSISTKSQHCVQSSMAPTKTIAATCRDGCRARHTEKLLAAQIRSANRRNSRDEMRCPPLTSLAFRHRIRAIVVSSARLRVLQEYALRQGLLTYPKVKLKPMEEIQIGRAHV